MESFLIFVVFCILNVSGRIQMTPDHSPYCEDLAKITDLCNEVFIQMMCPRTCQNEHRIKRKCGSRNPFANIVTKRSDGDCDSNTRSRVRRIVGGTPSVKGAWPWQIALLYKGKQYCAGALLTPDWVMTAAHCFNTDKTSFNEADWIVVAGKHSLFVNEATEESRKVKKIIIHDRNYRYWKFGHENVPDDYDIALLKLDTPLLFNNFICPICLPGSVNFIQSSDDCKIMGWGATAKLGSRQNILREATVKIVPRDICNLPVSYNGTIHERAICAGYKSGKADACRFDSGGSMSCKKGNHWFAAGLVSWGYQCGTPNFYGVYTNVPLMKNWIIETLLSYDDKTNTLISLFKRIAEMSYETVTAAQSVPVKHETFKHKIH